MSCPIPKLRVFFSIRGFFGAFLDPAPAFGLGEWDWSSLLFGFGRHLDRVAVLSVQRSLLAVRLSIRSRTLASITTNCSVKALEVAFKRESRWWSRASRW
jgi:hypothetical protein